MKDRHPGAVFVTDSVELLEHNNFVDSHIWIIVKLVIAANKALFFPPFLGRISLLEEKAIDNGNKDNNDVSITSARHGRNEKEEQKFFIVIYIYIVRYIIV